MDPLRYDGRVALVTGAGRGIGRSHAMLLASRGAKVVVNDLGTGEFGDGKDMAPAEETVQEIVAGGGEAVSNFGDVSVASDAEAMIGQALEQYGRLDIVISNAGISRFREYSKMSDEDWDGMIDVHLRGTFNVTRASWPHLIAGGGGRMILTSSSGMLGVPNLAHYNAAKAGVYGIMKSLSVDGLRHSILVNAIWPNAETRLAAAVMRPGEDFPPEFQDYMPQEAPSASPTVISPIVAFLAHESCQSTGEAFSVGFGFASRVLVAQGPGYVNPNLTLEDVRDNWTAICAASPSFELPNGSVVAERATEAVRGHVDQ